VYRVLITLALLSLGAFWSPEAPAEVKPPSDRELAEQWAYDMMVAQAAPGRRIYYADGVESKEDAEKRYRSIAKDVIQVIYNPKTALPFKGKDARARTVTLVLGIMFHESGGYMKHVDYGLGKYSRGDEGHSWCLMQLNIGNGRTLRWNTKHDRPPKYGDPETEIFEGYLGQELVEDRQKCIQEGLKVVRVSFLACHRNPLLLKLASYTSGKCHKGLRESRVRMSTAIRWYESTKEFRAKFKEKAVVLAVAQELGQEENHGTPRKPKEKMASAEKPYEEG